MRNLLFIVITLLLLSQVAFISCNQPGATEENKMSFLDTAAMDKTVKPGDNFFEYVNGNWIKTAVIPGTESSIGSFLDVYIKTRDHIHLLLDSVAKGGFEKGSIEQQVGDFYASGMDSATIEKRSYDPLKPALSSIEGIKNAAGIMEFVAQQAMDGNNLLIGASINADEKNSSMNIAVFSQGGLGLPDRDYYFKTDAATAKVVAAYQAYVQKLFTLTGDDSIMAAKKMALVYGLEKQMAGSHRTPVELRDPQNNYNKMAISDLNKKLPNIKWSLLLNNVKVDSVDIQQPAFYNKLNGLLTAVPLDTWKAYLRFHTLNNSVNALSSAFVDAGFEYGKTLSGQTQLKPRWERMYGTTDGNLGEALGQLYVKKYFTDAAKKRMQELVNNLQVAFEARINKLDWMGDSTKKVSVDKLHSFLKKIGYTDKWRDYSKVSIDKSKYFENRISCARNEYNYQLGKLGRPVDKTEWGMTPPTINAYYNPTFNEIVFPAGILQFPFFDLEADDAINYGAIGMGIGHEMTHGFDDQGAQYDKEGNLKNWWSKEDKEKFKVKTNMVVEQYNKFTVLDSVHVNGALTTGENIADFGGVSIAYDAFKMTKQGQDSTKIGGFTPDQRFFLSLAQVWRSKEKEEITRQYINLDPHSPSMYRVNGPLMHFTPFYAAFNVKEGDKMFIPEKDRIKIW